MASAFNDLSQITAAVNPSILTQLSSGTTNGTSVQALIGPNRINMVVAALTGVGFTSLAVTAQASIDGVSNWVTIQDQGINETITITSLPTTVQIIPIQLPAATTTTGLPYQYVRASAVLVGTSVYCFAWFQMANKFGGGGVGSVAGVAANI